MQGIRTSLESLTEQYRAVTHNLANASTAGFKRRAMAFSTAGPTGQTPAGAADGSGAEVKIAGKTYIDFSQGALDRTGRPLDVALHGKGFFVLETPEGPLYTRNGVFRTNAAGQLVDADGRPLAGEAGPLVLPPSVGEAQVEITPTGRVAAAGQILGTLRIVEFEDASVLAPVGKNAFRAPASVRPGEGTGTRLQQGFREASNVNVVEELVGLIKVTRLYEANLKSVQVENERTKQLINVAMS